MDDPSVAYDAQADWQGAQRWVEDERAKQQEALRLAKKQRNEEQQMEDGYCWAKILCCWGLLNCVLFMCPLLKDSWRLDEWHASSIEKMSIEVGLATMHVEVTCKPTVTGDQKLCVDIKKYSTVNDGNWDLKDLEKQMSKAGTGSGDIIGKMAFAGKIPPVGLPTAAALEMLAVLLLSSYWWGKPTARLRSMANTCGALAFTTGALTILCWLGISPFLIEVPRRWAADAGHADAARSAMNGFKLLSGTGGSSSIVACITIGSSLLRFFLQVSRAAHPSEPVDETSALAADEQANAMYGA